MHDQNTTRAYRALVWVHTHTHTSNITKVNGILNAVTKRNQNPNQMDLYAPALAQCTFPFQLALVQFELFVYAFYQLHFIDLISCRCRRCHRNSTVPIFGAPNCVLNRSINLSS